MLYGSEEVEHECIEQKCNHALEVLGDANRAGYEPRELAIWQWRQNWGREVHQFHILTLTLTLTLTLIGGEHRAPAIPSCGGLDLGGLLRSHDGLHRDALL